MTEKKRRVAIYCRMGNPEDAGKTLEVEKNILRKPVGCTSGHDDMRESISLAGKKAMDEVFAPNYSHHAGVMLDRLFLKSGMQIKCNFGKS